MTENYEQQIVWRPSAETVQNTRLGRFLRAHNIPNLDALRERASRDPAWFWDAVIHMVDWPFVTPYHQVLDMSQGVEWTQWFLGGTSNLALAAMDRHVSQGLGDKVAVIEETESGEVTRWTYQDLKNMSDRLAHGFQRMGVKVGDRIILYLPMGKEVVASMMAAAQVGAIIVPVFSGYGAPALATRIKDSEADFIITADAFTRRGRRVPMKEILDAACQEAGSQARTIVVNRLGQAVPFQPERDVWWHDVIAQSPPEPYMTKVLPAETPVMLIYTSGTTGKPKGAVHTHLGFPLKATQDLWHAFDLQASDVFFWYTDIGWMMGPWMIYGGLITGATLLLYDGTPDFPNASRLWDMIDRHGVSVFGISPTAIRGLMAHGEGPLENHSLASLRILGSSGEPWNLQPWRWFFEKVGQGRCPIINYSGGTEISGGILSAFADQPQKPMAFNGPVPGMAAEVVDEEGRPIENEVGELVIRAPWPGMTRGFWHDQERYLDAYWHRWPHTWVHGDFARKDSDGFWYILGRSDDTIKVAGKRLGPAEVESILVSHPQVIEAAAIGVPDPIKGEALVCFVVASEPTADLGDELKRYVADHLGRALSPKVVHVVSELPKTRNGKVVRRVLRSSYLGREAGDLSSVENAGVLQDIRSILNAEGS